MPETEKAGQEEIHYAHVQATNYRVAVADSAVVSTMGDALGTTFHLVFTRMDATPVAETISVVRKDEGIMLAGKPTFETPLRKVQEFGVLLRPDCALRVAQLLFEKIAELSPDQRKRYGLPEISVLVEKQSVEEEKK